MAEGYFKTTHWIKVWENENPNQNFAAQTIDLSNIIPSYPDYTDFVLIYKNATSSYYYYNRYGKLGQNVVMSQYVNVTSTSYNITCLERLCQTNNSGFIFKDSYFHNVTARTATIDNSRNIPIAIYLKAGTTAISGSLNNTLNYSELTPSQS